MSSTFELRKLVKMYYQLVLVLCLSFVIIGYPKAAAQHEAIQLPPSGSQTDVSANRESRLTYFILDASRSMWGRIEEKPKIEIAKQVITDLLSALGSQHKSGVTVFGHRRADDCSDIEEIVPIGAGPRVDQTSKIATLNPVGKSPIADSILQVVERIKNHPGNRRIILISDGVEACDKDPCVTVRSLKGQNIEFTLDVVGMAVSAEEAKLLQCIAEAGGGKFTAANHSGELLASLTAITVPEALPSATPLPVATLSLNSAPTISLPTPISGTIRKAVPSPAFNAVSLTAKRGQGKLVLKRDVWLLKPFYWKLIDVESGAEVAKKSSFEEQVPEGNYLLAWRQYEHGSTEVIVDSDVSITKDETTTVNLSTAIRLNVPSFVRQPNYWGLRDPESKEELAIFRTFEPFLVPPGEYELIWRQYDDRAETLSFGTIIVEEGKTNYFTLNSSLRIKPADWMPDEVHYWGLKAKGTDEFAARYYDSFDSQLVPPGSYTVIYRQSEADSSDSLLGEVEVTMGGESEFAIETGVRVVNPSAQLQARSVEFAKLDSEGKIVRVVRQSNLSLPMPLEPGVYRISYNSFDSSLQHSITVAESFEIPPGVLTELNLEELLNPEPEPEEDLLAPLLELEPEETPQRPAFDSRDLLE
ncbi:MAG: VWA domain-containing protein [Deltaproteobacteria bacterium]|nr:VWA domain-containing protein [Deltaproteobacteria bacterium]